MTTKGDSFSDLYTVAAERMVAGGAALGRLGDGRVAIADGAIAGETIELSVTKAAKRHVEGRAVSVDVPSKHRVDPPCAHAHALGGRHDLSCGGCDWQHIEPSAASAFRRDIVVDSLRRIGKVAEPEVVVGPELDASNYRTIVRAGVADGRAGFRRPGSHDLASVDSCLVAHPLAEDIVLNGRFPGASEIEITVGARTQERLVLVTPSPAAADAQVPDGVIVVAQNGTLHQGPQGYVHEVIDGHRYRISADSFFQCRPDGADVLVDTVRTALGGALDVPGQRLLDAYGGVGLFGVALGAGHHVVNVEANPSSIADAKVNMAESGAASYEVVRSNVEDWTPEPFDVVVADPARRGLDQAGVDVLAATGASTLVLVSCDPASLGRDARMLIEAGFELGQVTTVDLFSQTSHVEAVSTFRRMKS